MPGLDTNVLVRWLVEDDEQQTTRVQKLFESTRGVRATLFVPVSVVLELEWVLRSRYRFSKAKLLQAFNALLETVERALGLYRLGNAEFADCLHAGLCGAEGRAPLLTFDEKAARLQPAQLL
jgi:predicted nucleic-acid-binding protein